MGIVVFRLTHPTKMMDKTLFLRNEIKIIKIAVHKISPYYCYIIQVSPLFLGYSLKEKFKWEYRMGKNTSGVSCPSLFTALAEH